MVPADSVRIPRVPTYSGCCSYELTYVYGIITLFDRFFQNVLLRRHILYAVLLPRHCRNNDGLGFSPVARHYWGNHVCFLFLQVLRCFSSLRLPPLLDDMSSTYRVAPFGDLRIYGYLHLPEAFRSLSRPSSPLRA